MCLNLSLSVRVPRSLDWDKQQGAPEVKDLKAKSVKLLIPSRAPTLQAKVWNYPLLKDLNPARRNASLIQSSRPASLSLGGFLGANIGLSDGVIGFGIVGGSVTVETDQKILQGEKPLRFRLLPHPRATCSTGASFTGLASPVANILPAVLVAGVT